MDFLIPLEWLIGIIAVLIGLALLAFFSGSYTVVPPHEAHVVIQGAKGRFLYSAEREDPNSKGSRYYKIPIVQQRTVLPLRIKQLVIEDIPLRDQDVAKFQCDVSCWIRIDDPILAATRIGEQERIKNFEGIEDDVKNLVKSVTRNSSMKMDLLSLMSDRLSFSKKIAEEITPSIKEWGIGLVDLECIHFVDVGEDENIANLEKRQSKKIESITRSEVAERDKEAAIAESEAERETKEKQAENMEKYRLREIQKDEEVGKREQEKIKEVQTATQDANTQQIEAEKALTVGKAEYEKEAKITTAEGEAEKVRTEGKAAADVVGMKGDADAHVIIAKGTSEAEAIDLKAESQKKYKETGAFAIEVISKAFDTYRDIQVARFEELGQALAHAKVTVYSTGKEKSLLGIPIDIEGGLAAGSFLEGIKETSGLDIGTVVKDVAEAVKDVAKDLVGKKEAKRKPKEPKRREKT